jgi:hypothetical protein
MIMKKAVGCNSARQVQPKGTWQSTNAPRTTEVSLPFPRAPQHDPHTPQTQRLQMDQRDCRCAQQGWAWQLLGPMPGPYNRDRRGQHVQHEANTKGHKQVGTNACSCPSPHGNNTAGCTGRDQGARGCELVPGANAGKLWLDRHNPCLQRWKHQGNLYLCNGPAARPGR